MQKKEGIKPPSRESEKFLMSHPLECRITFFGMYDKHYIHPKLYQKLYIL